MVREHEPLLWGQRRLFAGLSLMLVALLGLSGCTPAPKRMTALHLVGRRPTLLVAPCPEIHPYGVSVYAKENGGRLAWSINRDTGRIPDQITLLEVPEGWNLARRQESPLQRLVPGLRYGVAIYAYGGNSSVLTFTLEDLARLETGQVLVAGEGPSDGKVMSEAEFRSMARKDCS